MGASIFLLGPAAGLFTDLAIGYPSSAAERAHAPSAAVRFAALPMLKLCPTTTSRSPT